MKKIILILLITIYSLAGFAQQDEIIEEMKIKWWVVPIFASDKNGKPVLGLKKKDIILLVNKKPVQDFYLIQKELMKEPKKAVSKSKTREFIPVKKRMIFFLIDLVYTGQVSLKKYKKIITDMVTKADENSQFFLFSISGRKGLVYHTGPTDYKKELIQIVNKINTENVIKMDDLIRRERFREERDLKVSMSDDAGMDEFVQQELERMIKSSLKDKTYRKNLNYFQSFRYLYYIINSIKSNKFVYLFSRGIPSYAFEDMGPGSVITRINDKVENITRDLNAAGAMFTVINPLGGDSRIKRFDPEEMMTSMEIVAKNIDNVETGEFFVRQLAKQSGGKYFEGTVSAISNQMQDYHQAYYELAFSDIPAPEKKRREIKVKSKKKGVNLYTFKSVKEDIRYSFMENIEKRLHVINTLMGNIPTSKMIFDIKSVNIVDQIKKADSIVYKLKIPHHFLNEELDFYKIRISPRYEIPKIEIDPIIFPSEDYELKIFSNPLEVVLFMFIKGDDLSALAYGMDEKAEYYHLITILNPVFSDQILQFDLKNYKRSADDECLVAVQVGIFGKDENEIYKETKILSPNKDSLHISIPFRNILEQDVKYLLIKAKDLITERSTVKMISVSR